MNFLPYSQSYYKIMSALDEDMVLDCLADQDNPLILWKWHEGDNQKWKIQKIQNNKFRFFNVMNSKVMSSPVHNLNSTLQEAAIKCKISKKLEQQIFELFPCYQQRFRQKFAFYIKSSSGKVVDVFAGKAKNGQNIIEWQLKQNTKIKDQLNQIWLIQQVSFISQRKAVYKIFSALDYDLVFDASKDPVNLKDIMLYHCHKGDNQKFYLHSYNGKYLITNKQFNLSVQVKEKKEQNQANIIVGELKKQPHQLWDIVCCDHKDFIGKGAYYIRSFCGKFLDISNGKAIEAASIIQWDFNGNKNQIWFFQKI